MFQGLPGNRVPLKSSYASTMPQQTAVFMYSTAGPDGQTVTLQLRETDETIELPAAVLSKMSRQTDTTTLSISYQDSAEVLTDGTIDLLLATTPLHSAGKSLLSFKLYTTVFPRTYWIEYFKKTVSILSGYVLLNYVLKVLM